MFLSLYVSADTTRLFIFSHENMKKRASKVAHNRLRPFYFTVQPKPQPTAQNWFFILWNVGTRHLFSYLCLLLLFWGILCWLNKTDTKVAKGQRRLKVINFGIFGTCEKIEEFWHNFMLKPKLYIPSTINIWEDKKNGWFLVD